MLVVTSSAHAPDVLGQGVPVVESSRLQKTPPVRSNAPSPKVAQPVLTAAQGIYSPSERSTVYLPAAKSVNERPTSPQVVSPKSETLFAFGQPEV